MAFGLNRGLRNRDMRLVTFGFGKNPEHVIIPRTCQTSIDYTNQATGGCDGSLWIHLTGAWNPFDLITSPSLKALYTKAQKVFSFSMDGKATIFLDFSPDGGSERQLSYAEEEDIVMAKEKLDDEEELKTETKTSDDKIAQDKKETGIVTAQQVKVIKYNADITAKAAKKGRRLLALTSPSALQPRSMVESHSMSRSLVIANRGVARQEPSTGAIAYLKRVGKLISNIGFSILIDAEIAAHISIGYYFKIDVELFVMARLYLQINTQAMTGAAGSEYSADGMYAKITLAGTVSDVKKPSEHAGGGRQGESEDLGYFGLFMKLVEKYKQAMSHIASTMPYSSVGAKIAASFAKSKAKRDAKQDTLALITDEEFERETDGVTITVQINGGGVSLIFSIGEKSASFRITDGGHLEVCTRFAESDKCNGPNIVRTLTNAVSKAANSIFNGFKKSAVRAEFHIEATPMAVPGAPYLFVMPQINNHEMLIGDYTIRHRYDQMVAHVFKNNVEVAMVPYEVYKRYLKLTPNWADASLAIYIATPLSIAYEASIKANTKVESYSYLAPTTTVRVAFGVKHWYMADTDENKYAVLVDKNMECIALVPAAGNSCAKIAECEFSTTQNVCVLKLSTTPAVIKALKKA